MLTVAYIAPTTPSERYKPPTAKEKLHAAAIAAIAAWRVKARVRAKKLFAPEWEAINRKAIKLNINL